MFDRVYRRLGLFLLLPICLLLWGCHAVHAGITKRELRVDTRVSQTIFIEPLPESQKIVYVDANFVGNNASAFQHQLMARLRSKGYKVTHDVRLANYIIKSNAVRYGRFEHPGEENRILMRGFGGAVTGAIVGSLITDDAKGAVVGGLVGSIVNMSVENRHYILVSDLQISQRISGSMVYKWSTIQQRKKQLKKHFRLHSDGAHVWARYRTRVVSTASRFNLAIPVADRALNQALVNTISRLF
jgi:hypothetical protein